MSCYSFFSHRAPFLAKSLFICSLIGFFSAARASASDRVSVYSCFDSEYFYLAANIAKPTLSGKQTAYFSDPKLDDCLGVSLQLGDPADVRTAKSISMIVSVAGGVQLYRGANATPLTGFQDLAKSAEGKPVPFKYGVSRQGKIGGPSSNDNSYSIEIAIPWVELGAAPIAGQRMSFNVFALSSTADSPAIQSASLLVKSLQDIDRPTAWGEVIFVDSPVKSVASAPLAKVCYKLFSSRPVIDGVIDETIWSSLTSFSFGGSKEGGPAPVNPKSGPARIREELSTKVAPEPSAIPKLTHPTLKPRTPQIMPKLVFAKYRYDYQNDTRKSIPLRSVSSGAGALLPVHPLSGTGPWMTYDRVDWHLQNLSEVRRAGISVVLPIYRSSVSDKQRGATHGLLTMVAALNTLSANGSDVPLVGMYLDTASLFDHAGAKLDLTKPSGQDRLYIAVKEFFQLIPDRFRLSVPLSIANGGNSACVVVISSVKDFANWNPTAVSYLRNRFADDFGYDLIVIGEPSETPAEGIDGYLTNPFAIGQSPGNGWVQAATVSPGIDTTLVAASKPVSVHRRDGTTYKDSWKQAIKTKADWVIIDSWNDYDRGTAIGSTLEHGLQYADSTRASIFAFGAQGSQPLRASFIGHSVPRLLPQKSALSATVRVVNSGSVVWEPDQYAVKVGWTQNGQPVGQQILARLSQSVIPGQTLSVPVLLPGLDGIGTYVFRADVVQLSKKGDISVAFSGIGSSALEVAVETKPSDDKASFACSIVSMDLPGSIETGGQYSAHITLRNDGISTWKVSDGVRILPRLFRYVSPVNGTGEPESVQFINMADGGSDLTADVPPGGTISLNSKILCATGTGELLPAWNPADSWHYEIRWELRSTKTASMSCWTNPEPLEITDTDFGLRFVSDFIPLQLPADRKIPIRLSVANNGAQSWVKGQVKLGYHWYYLDGTELVWQDELTPVDVEMKPGSTSPEIMAYITAPPNDGQYWLVWDSQFGDTWSSTQIASRTSETLVRLIEVIGGKLSHVDLTAAFNFDGVSGPGGTDGNFDVAGRTFPDELVPPYPTLRVVPGGMWQSGGKSGTESSKKFSFRWGGKLDKERNFVQCVGQKIPLTDPKKSEIYKYVHVIAASTRPSTLGSFTLVYGDSTEQLITLRVDKWDSPQSVDEVAWQARYSRTRTGDDLKTPVRLYHYTLRVAEKKKLSHMILPNSPEIKISAITLEK